MKKPILAVLIAVAAGAALLACAVGLSHLIWHRSLQATVYERICAHRFANARTVEQEIERLERKRADGEKPSATPGEATLRAEIARDERDGMTYFTLNAGDAAVTIFYLHGGAYINGFNDYHWRLMDALIRDTGAEIVAPDYHLAPFGGCARAYEDLTGLYLDYIAAHPGRRVILMGDSAGGGLALGLAESFVQAGIELPERLILISPWVDVTMENPDIESYLPVEPILHLDLVKVHGRYWADGLDPHEWRVSPLFGDMAGLPPVSLYTGTRELLYPDLMLLNDALARAGVDVDFHVGRGLNHEYPLMPIPEGRRAVGEMARTILGGAE